MHEYEYIPSKTGTCKLCVYLWDAPQPKAVLQIVHGMAEHMGRYGCLGEYLSGSGIAVIGHDIAGHGRSIGPEGLKGYFGPGDGWGGILADIDQVADAAARRWPGVPRILMGHSMGSFLVECHMARKGGAAAYILSGTAGKNPALPFGRMIARAQIALGRGRRPSMLLNTLSFGAYNTPFKPARTPFDWLSRDEAEVDKYMADELCGFAFTAEAFCQLFGGMGEIAGRDWPERTEDKPILIISGDRDPVGGMGKGVYEIAGRLEKAGRQVELRLYPGGRHELLNGPDRELFCRDIREFILRQVRV